MPAFLAIACLAFLALLPAGARAHLEMTKPVSRYGARVLKEGPCGVSGGQRSENINYFEPGETIEVAWDEYVDHPGHYRIAFDEDGDDDFVDPATMMELNSNHTVLLDDIEDKGSEDSLYSVMVTLPDVECENCTLQLIQMMYDKEPYGDGNDIYYQCADLVLRRGGVPDPGIDPDAGADAGTGTGAGADAGPGADTGPGADADADPGSGGCSVGSGEASGFGIVVWIFALFAWRLARRHGLTV